MRLRSRKVLWLSAAAGSAVLLVLLTRRRSSRSVRTVPAGYQTRIAPDSSQKVSWRFDRRIRTLPAGYALRVETVEPAVVHWSVDQWDSVEDTHTTEIASHIHAVDLATEELAPGVRVHFTFYWPDVNRWEGEDFEVKIAAAGADAARTAQADPD